MSLKIIKVGGGLKKMIKVNQHHKLYVVGLNYFNLFKICLIFPSLSFN